jgi:hypothetical protein
LNLPKVKTQYEGELSEIVEGGDPDTSVNDPTENAA